MLNNFHTPKTNADGPTSVRSGACAVLAVLGTLGQSCILSGVVPSVVEPPPMQARAVQFLGANGAQSSVRLELVAYNPNSFALYAQNLRATLSVAGHNYGVLEAEFHQQLPSRRPLVVLVDVSVQRTGAAPTAVLDLGQGPNGASAPSSTAATLSVERTPMPFRVDGVVYFRSRYGTTHAPFAYQGTVSPAAL
jgi:hypothetical protein